MMVRGCQVEMYSVNGWQDREMLRMLRTHTDRIGLVSKKMIIPIFLFILFGLGVLSANQPKAILLVTAGLPVGLGLIAWPQVTLGLYANAGLFKADPRLRAISSSVDITLALGALLAGTIAYRLIVRRERMTWRREMSLALIFAGVILLGLLYTPAGSYATDKAFRFVSLTMLAFFAPVVFIKSYRSVWLFLVGWLGLATVLVADALSHLGTYQRISGFNATHIAISRATGIAIIILLFAVLMGRVSRHWQILAIAGMVPLVLVMIGSGARGPLLMLPGTVVLTLGITFARPGYRRPALIVIGIMGFVVLGVFSSGMIPESSLERFNLLINEPEADTSAQARRMVMEVAWQLFTSNPVIGRGTGSVSVFGAGREQIYPHNILLELAAENGLLGLSLYLGVVGMVLWQLLTKLGSEANQESLRLTLLAMLLFTLFNAMVSGDLSDNRDLWLFAGVTIATTEIGGEPTS
jgi:O-antigen ligase